MTMKTRYFVDTEFIDDGKTIDLISVGIVCEDGRELYLQSVAFNPKKASPWVKENVFPHLEICPWAAATVDSRWHYVNDLHYHKRQGQCVDQIRGRVHNCPWRTREHMRREIEDFLEMDSAFYDRPELWFWCGSYDHVALCQLFGTMMDTPQHWPHYVRDIQYILDEKGITDDMLPKQEGDAHHALADAKYIKKLWETVCQ